jgi:membrane protein YdbS with pleckstrin-like domain
MYSAFRGLCERLLRIPHDPSPPPGDEASTRIFRAAPNYYRYLLCLWALKSAIAVFVVVVAVVVPMAVGTFSLAKGGRIWAALLSLIPLLVLAVDVLLCVVNLVIVRLDYEKRWYVVTDRSLRIREGVVRVREMTVNFANIQNITISQGPVQRVLAIADVRVDTAGGGGRHAETHRATENLHTAWFRGVNNASEIRELIQQRLRLLKDSGLGDHEEMSASAPVSAGIPGGLEPTSALLCVLRETASEARALREALN